MVVPCKPQISFSLRRSAEHNIHFHYLLTSKLCLTKSLQGISITTCNGRSQLRGSYDYLILPYPQPLGSSMFRLFRHIVICLPVRLCYPHLFGGSNFLLYRPFFSMIILLRKNRSILMRLLFSLCVSLTTRTPVLVFMKFSVYIMPSEAISMAHFTQPSHQ
jgi:hypothetical protein